jgi:PAS domain S-box-containing protein
MQSEHPFRKTYGWLAVIFSVLTAGIGLAGYLYYLHHEKAIKQRVWDELAAVADLKTSQIAQWRGGRTACARTILKNPYTAAEVRQWFKRPGDSARRQKLLAWLEDLKGLYRFQSVVLLDEQGGERLSVAGGKPPAAQLKALAAGTLRAKGALFSDLRRDDTSQGIHLAVTAPLLIRQGPGAVVVGVLVFWIDPREELYPLIQSWPIPSPPAETLLVSREGDEVVYLNELRHRRNAAFVLRFPVGSAGLPAAMAVSGKEGMIEGSDYRGVPVLAAVRHIPDSPWHLVAKMDTGEVYAPIRERAWLTTILTGLLIVASGLSVGLAWRSRDLTERKRAQERIAYQARLLNEVNDAVISTDENYRITFWNRAAERLYGLSAEEVISKEASEVVPNPHRAEARRALAETGAWRGEVAWVRENGRELVTEHSASVIRSAEGKHVGTVVIVRDITERKRAEAALREGEAALRASREELRALAAGLLTAQDDERRRLSRELHDDLNQKLAMLAVEFESLEQQHPVLPEGIRHQLGSLKSRVVELSDDLRRMAYQLHPAILEHLGLVVALKSYCEEFSKREKVEARLTHHNVPTQLPLDTALCLYRVVQEGLRNVARHSSSPSVTVSLAGNHRSIRLSITDLGVGFDPLAAKGRGGLGLVSMEERVRLVQGHFTVHSQPGRGARIEVRIPLPAKAAAPPA